MIVLLLQNKQIIVQKAKGEKNILYEAGQSPRKRFYLENAQKRLEIIADI